MSLVKIYEGTEVTIEGYKGQYPVNGAPFEIVDENDAVYDFSSSEGIYFRLLRQRHSTQLALIEMTNILNVIYLDGDDLLGFKPGTYYCECYWIDGDFSPSRKRILFKGPFIQT